MVTHIHHSTLVTLSRNIWREQFYTPLIIMDSETIHDNLMFTIATAAIAEIQLYYKKNVPFLKYHKISLKGYTFMNDNIYDL